jgi:hypothetical protein
VFLDAWRDIDNQEMQQYNPACFLHPLKLLEVPFELLACNCYAISIFLLCFYYKVLLCLLVGEGGGVRCIIGS